ncbi:MAG TPA: universal stress protein [Usitatibacter sp.]|nr:universal stress protein [Usitatibacter sp.]
MYFSPLLIPYDGSRASRQAVEYVAEHLGASPIEVCLLNVQSPVLDDPSLLHAAGAMVRSHRAIGQRMLEPAREALSAAGIQHTAEVEFGDPADAIAWHAQRGGFNMIVVGNRRQRGLADFFRGSVVRRLIDRSRVPVMVVHDEGEPVLHRQSPRDAPFIAA